MQLPIDIDSQHGATLQSQIVTQLRALIETRRLPPGSLVPASRELSKQLGVSRNTVTSAYEELISEGYLHAERAIGTYVTNALPEALADNNATQLDLRAGSSYRAVNLPLPYAGRGVPGLHRTTPKDVEVDFVFGRCAPRSFPEKAWRKIIHDLLSGAAEPMSEYGDPAGLPELRQLITSILGPARGITVAAEQVLVVSGFQQGIQLAAHLFVGNNTPIVMEAPTYRGAAFLFESYGGTITPVPVDQHGIDVNRLPTHHVKLVYVTPSHQFPTGAMMSLHRRLALLEWAARVGAYILEVDHDADFRYEGSPLPSLQSLDRNGCVIYLNSFSRSLGPGLRIGYMVVPRHLIKPALTIKALLDNGLPWLEQAALAQYIRTGSWETHVKKLRHTYEARRNALLDGLRANLSDASVSGADAGTHVCVTLPPSSPLATQVQHACRNHGVGVYPLADSPAWFCEHLTNHDRTLLTGYAHLNEAQIARGCAIWGAALRE